MSDSSTLTDVSFERVYRLHAGFVRRVLSKLGVAAHVEDALQDVFVVVHCRLHDFDGKHALRSWLYEIARRVASHYRRSLRRAIDCERIEYEVADRSPGPLDLAQQRETLDVLAALLWELGADKRQLLVLVDFEEHSVPELAELTGTCLSTIYTRLRRARQALQASARWQQLIQHIPEHRQVTACGS